MFLVRRLLSAFLALAFASYGAVASASVHAHTVSDHHNSSLHSVAQDFVADDGEHEGFGHTHTGDVDHDTAPASGDTPQTGEHEQGIVFHAHAVAAFTTVAEPLVLQQLFVVPLKRNIQRTTVSVSGLFSPLLKPPRTFL